MWRSLKRSKSGEIFPNRNKPRMTNLIISIWEDLKIETLKNSPFYCSRKILVIYYHLLPFKYRLYRTRVQNEDNWLPIQWVSRLLTFNDFICCIGCGHLCCVENGNVDPSTCVTVWQCTSFPFILEGGYYTESVWVCQSDPFKLWHRKS